MTSARRDELAMEAWSALKGAATAMLVRAWSLTPGGGAQQGHMGFLHALADADGPIKPTELARKLDLTPATVTGAITQLEDLGLILRTRDEADRRAVHVTITPKGRDVQRKWADAMRANVREVLGPLSEDELATLARLLVRIAPPIHGPPRGMIAALRHDLPAASGKRAKGRKRARSR